MNYIGSKKSLLSFIEETISGYVDLSGGVFCDLFSGTGVVANHFSTRCATVLSNDLEYYSYVLRR